MEDTFIDKVIKAVTKVDKLTKIQADNIALIVKACRDNKICNFCQIAYILATVYYECNFESVEECAESKAKWEPGHSEKDIKRYYGRGFVQLTNEENYEKMDKRLHLNGELVEDPDMALNPELAAKILVIGMIEGLFTGHKLSQYINEKETNFIDARKIVNGMNRAETIAGKALRYSEAMGEKIKFDFDTGKQ